MEAATSINGAVETAPSVTRPAMNAVSSETGPAAAVEPVTSEPRSASRQTVAP